MRSPKLRRLTSWTRWHLRQVGAWACGGYMRPGRAKRVFARAVSWLGTAIAVGVSGLAVACQAPGVPLRPVAVQASLPAPQPGVRTAEPARSVLPDEAPTPPASVAPAAPTQAPAPAVATWLAYGDSLTYQAFQDLAGWDAAFAPGAAPAVRNAGVPGMSTHAAQLRLDAVLATYPDAAVVGLAFGTNDAYSGIVAPADVAARLREMAGRIRASGRTPVLARIPWGPHPQLAAVPAFNAAIADLERELALPPGPDLYAWFEAHPEEIGEDGVHLTAAGAASVRRLWAEALRDALAP